MSNKEINHENLKNLCNALEAITEYILNESKTILNKDADIFSRYMAFSRMSAIAASFTHINESSRLNFNMGYDLANKQFETKESKSKGWHTDKLTDNPFFVDESNDDENVEISSVAEKALARAILQALKGEK